MQLQGIASASVIGSVRLILATASPLQSLLDKPCTTHEFCNNQAISILANDGFRDCVNFFSHYLVPLNAGVVWADQGWKNVNHYFEPNSRKGLWQFSTAVEEFGLFMSKAKRNMRRNDLSTACFYLGAAAHLLQDLCVPHHARGKVFDGHSQYETWAREHCAEFAADRNGLYDDGPTVNLLFRNASVSADLLEQVVCEGDAVMYAKSTAILLPLAQQSTAGLFQRFFHNWRHYSSSHGMAVVA